MVKVEIYSKDYCPYCKKAKMLIEAIGLKFEEHNVENQIEFDKLKQKTGHLTVPQIFIDGQFIGGADNLEYLIRSGEISKYVSQE